MVAKKKTIKKTTHSAKKVVRKKPAKRNSKKVVKTKLAKAKKKKSAKELKKIPVVSQIAVTKIKAKQTIHNKLAEKYYQKYKAALEEVYDYFEQEMDARKNNDTKQREYMKEQGYRAQEKADKAYGDFLKLKARDENE